MFRKIFLATACMAAPQCFADEAVELSELLRALDGQLVVTDASLLFGAGKWSAYTDFGVFSAKLFVSQEARKSLDGCDGFSRSEEQCRARITAEVKLVEFGSFELKVVDLVKSD